MGAPNADKEQIIHLVNRLISRSGLAIDQVVARMQIHGCDISRSIFENRFTTRVDQKPNIEPQCILALISAFTERLTEAERCTAAEAIELARLAQLPIDQFKILAQLLPPNEFDAAYHPYDPRSGTLPTGSPPRTSLNRSAGQDSPEQIPDAEPNISAAGARSGQRKIGRQRWSVILGLLVGGLIVLGLAWLALNQRQQLAAERQATLSRQLAAQALDHLPDRFDLALLLSTAAYQTANTYEARNGLLSVLQTSPHLDAYLRGHRGWVWDVAFSPDGRTLASGSTDGKIIFWDMATRRPLILPLTNPASWVRTIAFSPDGNILASGSVAGDIILWDVSALVDRADSTELNNAKATPQPLGPPLTDHAGFITDVAFSPDGRTLASSSADGTVRLWDVREPQSNDGTATQQIGLPLTGHTGWVLDVAFSPDGQTLASAGTDQTIILWDVSTRLTSVSSSELASSEIVGFTDGETGRKAETVFEDDADSPPAYALTGHQGTVLSVAFSPDGQTLASGSADRTIRLWDVATRGLRGQPLTGHQGEVNKVVFSPDGQTLASAGEDKTAMLWDASSGQRLDQSLLGHTDAILGLAFSPNSQTVASGSVDNTVILWDLATTHPLARSLIGHTNAVRGLSFSPNAASGTSNQVLASAGNDFTLRLWDISTGKSSGPPLTGHASLITDLAFSPDGQILASTSDDRSLLLWDVQSRQLLGPLLKNHPHPLINLALIPGSYQGTDGSILAVSDESRNVILWNLTTRRPLDPPLPIKGRPVVFSPDGRFLAGANGTKINVWDMATGQALEPALSGHIDVVRSLAFSPDGRILASGSADKTIILWDVDKWQPLGQPLLGHTDLVWSLAFSPNGRLLASGGEDGQLILWDVSTILEADGPTPRPLGRPLVNGDRIWRVAFSPDSRFVASAGRNDGVIMLWQVSPEAWQTRVCDIVKRNLTLAEWQRYVGHRPYRMTCPDAPPPPDTEIQVVVPTPVGTPPLPDFTPTDQPDAVVPIIEEFDSAQGFIQTSDNIQIADGQVDWHFQRSGGVQYIYRSIPPFSGDIHLTVRGQVDSWTNNCSVLAGIGDEPGAGLAIEYGWTGGGCPTNGPFVYGLGVTLDMAEQSCEYTGNWLWINGSTPYTAELTALNGAATLSVEGVGQASGEVHYEGPYTTLWVGNTGRGDWPECMGKIDAVIVEALE